MNEHKFENLPEKEIRKILKEVIGSILEIWQYGGINDKRGHKLVKIESKL